MLHHVSLKGSHGTQTAWRPQTVTVNVAVAVAVAITVAVTATLTLTVTVTLVLIMNVGVASLPLGYQEVGRQGLPLPSTTT